MARKVGAAGKVVGSGWEHRVRTVYCRCWGGVTQGVCAEVGQEGWGVGKLVGAGWNAGSRVRDCVYVFV